MKPFLFILLATVILLTACQVSPCAVSKDDYMNRYAMFLENTRQRSSQTTQREWDANDQKMMQMLGDCYQTYQANMTIGEKIDIWLGALKYAYYRLGLNAFVEFFNPRTENQLMQKIQENFDTSNPDAQDALEQFFKEIGFDPRSASSSFEELLRQGGEMLDNFLKEFETAK